MVRIKSAMRECDGEEEKTRGHTLGGIETGEGG